MRSFLLILFCFPSVLLSQNKRTVFIEGGTSINQSFYPTESIKTDLYPFCATGSNGPIGYSNTLVKRSSTFSCYSKLGIETPIVQKKHFSFSIPFIFGYREQRENYSSEIEEIYYSTTNRYTTKTTGYSKIASLIFGPKVTMDFKKLSFFTSVNVNTDLFFFEKTTTQINKDYGSYKNVSAGSLNDMMFNLSLENGILYNINSKISVGLTGDFFFYNLAPNTIKYHKKDNHLFNLGYGTNSTIINTGIRLQYSF